MGLETTEAETDATMTARVDATIAGTETIEAETDATTTVKAAEASQPTTIGPARNATIPTLPAARSATAAKSPDPAVAASATTVVDGTTEDSETIVVEIDASMIGREVVTTEAVGTTADPSEARSTTTTGPARSVTTPTSRSETPATGAKPPGRVAAVAVVNEVEVALPTAANAAEETEGSEMADVETVETVGKVAPKAAEAMARAEGGAHNAEAPPMEASEGPKASAPATPITAHHAISDHLVPLNERKTERTCYHERRIALPQCARSP